MTAPPPRDLLRLTDIERTRLLTALAKLEASDSPDHDERRASRRWDFRNPEVHLTVDHPGGGSAQFVVCARNISAGGISVLHGGFVHNGSNCKVTLNRRDGQDDAIPARVTHCRHVHGSVHEIGLQFERNIDPTSFVTFDDGTACSELDTINLADLRGRVLSIDDTEADQRILNHHLRATNIVLTNVATAAEAIEMAALRPPDIVLCDINLGADDGVGAIRSIREGGFKGPIVLVSAEMNETRIKEALDAGADEHLVKPYTPNDLLTLITRLHREIGAALNEKAIYSTLDHQPGMPDLIEAFIKDAHLLAQRLQEATANDDLDLVRELSLNIKGSAEAYGFAHLSNCATEALKSIDETKSVAESSVSLGRVSLICDNLSTRSSGKPSEEAASE